LRRSRAVVVLLAALGALSASPASASTIKTLAVFDPVPLDDTDPRLAAALANCLRTAVASTARKRGFKVQSESETERIAARNPKWSFEFGNDELEIARLAGVALLLSGTIERHGREFEVELLLYDVAAENVIDRLTIKANTGALLLKMSDAQTRASLERALSDNDQQNDSPATSSSMGGLGFRPPVLPPDGGLDASDATPSASAEEACDFVLGSSFICDSDRPDPLREASDVLACRQGDASACYLLGLLYEHCDSEMLKAPCPAPDFARAREFFHLAAKLFSAACKKGNAASCRTLGVMALNKQDEDAPQTVARAENLLVDACAKGDGEACCHMGNLYQDQLVRSGLGMKADRLRSVALFGRACALRHGTACHNLALMHLGGEGVEKDAAMASKLLEKACILGRIRACSTLGLIYFAGCGVEPDPSISLRGFKRACDGGDEVACLNVESPREDQASDQARSKSTKGQRDTGDAGRDDGRKAPGR
jgi:TPR repeat protein